MPVRIAAIEVGHWHALFDAAYLKTLARMAEVQIVAVHDPAAAMAAQRATQVGGPPVYTDYREMLAKTRPDFVLALGRHSVMAEIAHYLLDEGYPFMMEKPMGLNAREVRGVADKAVAKRAFVAVPLFQRFQPFMVRARRMLDEGAFGTLSHFYFRSNRPTSARYVSWGSPWMLDPAVAGGGCLRNIGLHGIDAFLHLVGDDAQVTGVQLSDRVHGARVEDYATLLLRTAGGVVATIEVGNTFPGKGADAEWKLAGRDALLVQREGALRCATAAREEAFPAEPGEPLPVIAVRDVLARWQAGQPPAAGVEDCYRAMRVVDEAYDAAKR
jgi:predicted dehydrogenase